MEDLNTNTPIYTMDQVESLVRQAHAKALASQRNDRPSFLSLSSAERSEREEKARLKYEVLCAVGRNDINRYNQLAQENPSYFNTKANFNETTSAQGGYLVPDEWAQEIALASQKYGFAPKLARVVPMGTKTIHLHTGTAISASFVAEGAAATLQDSSSMFSRVSLTAKLCKAALLWTEELEEDSLPALMDYFTEQLAEAMAKEVDRVFFKGQTGGGDAFNGILYVSGTNAVNMATTKTSIANLSWTNLIDTVAAVPDADLGDAKFVTSRAAYGYLRKELANSRPVWYNEGVADIAGQVGLDAVTANTVMTPLGYPMVVVPNYLWPTDAVSTGCVAFGAWSKYAIVGSRKDITQKVFNEYYNSTALSGQNKVLEFSQRVGIAFNDPAGFAILKTAAS
jgi:HK97 family phage major capsid protein